MYHTFNIVNISMIRVVVTEQFSCISAVLNVLQLLPVTSAEVERTHSAFKLIKKTGSAMAEYRLNALAQLDYHKDIPLAYEAIIDMYARRHPRSMSS